MPPNQISATLEMLITSVVTGSISACQRPAVSAVSDNAWFASRESVALERLPRERADHPDARKLFAHHPVDAVDQPLHAAEDGQQVRHDPVVGERQHRNADQQQPRQPGVLVHRHEDAADRHDRRGDQHGAGQLHQQLDLLDVVGGAGQQGRRAEPSRLVPPRSPSRGGRSPSAGRGRNPWRRASRSTPRRRRTPPAAR